MLLPDRKRNTDHNIQGRGIVWGDEVRTGGEGIKQEGLGQGWGGGWDGDDGGDAMDVGDGMEDEV